MSGASPNREINLDAIRNSYDRIAEEYACQIGAELNHKPFDREVLDRFALHLKNRGTVAEFGCGPGHVGRYLFDLGVDVFGVDLSPAMVEQAQRLNPPMRFQTGNMLATDMEDGSLAGIVAFYAIVNYPLSMLPKIFCEMHRVLRSGGLLLLAFHVGDQTLREQELWGIPISMDFFLLPTKDVTGSLESAGFLLDEVVERDPYPKVEYQSRRAYVLARKP